MTANDLMQKLLDYQHNWVLLLKNDSRPAKIRKQQIKSLQKAFGLSGKKVPSDTLSSASGSIEYLLSGEFLLERPIEKNREMAEQVFGTLKPLYPHIPFEKTNELTDIRWMFNDLLNFRQEVYKITHTSLAEESSPGLLYSQFLQRKLQDVIKDNLNEIDEALWMIVDPEKRTVDLNVLMEQYGYPDEDLEEVDLEWRMNGDSLQKSQEIHKSR